MRTTVLTIVAVLFLAACSVGSGGTDTTGPSTDEPATTTSSSDTTSTSLAVATSTTAMSATTTTVDPLAPMGSGCEPGTDNLPDGDWYGGVREFDTSGFTFDLACLFTGEAAVAAAAADGEEPPPNDYYVRNQSEQLRSLDVAGDTPVSWFTSGDPASETAGSYLEWIDFLSTQESYLGIWVSVRDGEVTEIYEWWVP